MAVTTATTNIENGIMPPPPRRAMGPAGTVDGTIGRFLLPIGGGGSAEVDRKFYFLIKKTSQSAYLLNRLTQLTDFEITSNDILKRRSMVKQSLWGKRILFLNIASYVFLFLFLKK